MELNAAYSINLSFEPTSEMKGEDKRVSLYHWIAIILVLSTAGMYILLTATSTSFSNLWFNYGSISRAATKTQTTLDKVVFGIAAGSDLWLSRKEYIRSWWKPECTRGFVWLDKMVKAEAGLPEIMISQDTSRFNYTFDGGVPVEFRKPQIRMCRVVSEMFRLGLPDVHWFVMGDDDTLFVVENVAKVLAKYDHTKFHYIGGISEKHIQNVLGDCCSNNMAYGGGGFAISHALAEALEKMLDECIQRYPHLFGGDGRIHACMSELGVPLTREPGFHQFDITGDSSGILGAHPVAPLLSMHHIDIIEPFFPDMTRQRSVDHLFSAAGVDPSGILQQSLCYSMKQSWSIQVSWGYAVQVSRQLLPANVIENPLRTFTGFGGGNVDDTFIFKTRSVPENPCNRPVMFYMKTVVPQGKDGSSVSTYNRGPSNGCEEKDALSKLSSITVYKQPTGDSWFQAPTRQCCRIMNLKEQVLEMRIRDCQKGEISAIINQGTR